VVTSVKQIAHKYYFTFAPHCFIDSRLRGNDKPLLSFPRKRESLNCEHCHCRALLRRSEALRLRRGEKAAIYLTKNNPKKKDNIVILTISIGLTVGGTVLLTNSIFSLTMTHSKGQNLLKGRCKK